MRPASPSIAQHRQASSGAAYQRIDKLLAVPSFLGSKPYRHASSSARKSSRTASIQVNSQASPYSLDPNMASLQYQPLNLPTSTVQSFDFLVLGSGIAGLTYALKVHIQPLPFVSAWSAPAAKSVCTHIMVLGCLQLFICVCCAYLHDWHIKAHTIACYTPSAHCTLA